jgi:hypothetical protein
LGFGFSASSYAVQKYTGTTAQHPTVRAIVSIRGGRNSLRVESIRRGVLLDESRPRWTVRELCEEAFLQALKAAAAEKADVASNTPGGQVPSNPPAAEPHQSPTRVQDVPVKDQSGRLRIAVIIEGEQSAKVENAIDDAFRLRPSIVRTRDGAVIALRLAGVQNRGIGSCKWRLEATALQLGGHRIFQEEKEYSDDAIWVNVAGECEKMIRQSVAWALDMLLEHVSGGAVDTVATQIPIAPRSIGGNAEGNVSPRPSLMRRAQSVALVIGIEKYRRSLPEAVGSAGDARVFASFAEQSLGLPRRNIRVLIDGDATRSSLDAEFDEWLPRNVSRGSDVFIFFAGHGAPEAHTGERFLVPWDADPAFIATQGLGLSKLLNRLAKLNAARVYVFLDACFTGSGGRSVLPAGTRPLIVMRRWPKPEVGRLLVLTASGPNETTGVSRSGHGLFSYYLFRGLNGEADGDRDGAVSFGELAAYTGEQVANEARRDNRDQHPRVIGTEEQTKTAILTRQSSR